MTKQARVLNDRELQRLLDFVAKGKNAKRNRAILLLTHFAGMRIGEVAAVRVADVLASDGTIRAEITPVTILTSNRTRELNDAVKRRCLYHWLDYPDRDRELAIVRAQVPGASAELTAQVAQFVDRLRHSPFGNAFQRAPGIAESVEWAKALLALDTLVIDPEVVADTAGILFKQREDVAALTHQLAVELLRPDEASETDNAA